MSTELNFFRFLKKLPSHDRTLYILLQYYRDSLIRFNDLNGECQLEAVSALSDVFEPDILNLLQTRTGVVELTTPVPPIYEAIRNERAEVSSTSSTLLNNKVDKLAVIRSIDKQFDDNLGEWGSSFSNSDDSEEPVYKEDPPKLQASDSIKRLSNASDLSSDEENTSHKHLQMSQVS